LKWDKEVVEVTPPPRPAVLRGPDGYAPGSASLGGGIGGTDTLCAVLIVGLMGEIAPGELALFAVLFVAVVGCHEVCRSHVEQLKLMA